VHTVGHNCSAILTLVVSIEHLAVNQRVLVIENDNLLELLVLLHLILLESRDQLNCFILSLLCMKSFVLVLGLRLW
jgi:hypothetical protein